MTKGRIIFALVFTGAMSGMLLLGGAAAKPEPALGQAQAKPSLSVSVTHPKTAELAHTITANGSIAAWQEAVIGSEVSDLHLSEVRAQVGDEVRKGQVLAVFADETVNVDIANSKALLAEAEANLEEAKSNSERARQIEGSGALSRQQIHQYLTSEKTAQARVQAAKAQLDAQLLRLKYTKVVAADDGVISSRSATLGAVVPKGEELFRMIRQNRLEWRGEVSAAEMAKLSIGMAAEVSVAGVGGVQGKIRALPPSLDAQNRNGLVYVDLPEASRQGLRAGMFAKGVFLLGHGPALSLPQAAVSLREGFSYVFRIVDKQSDLAKVKQAKVLLGRQDGPWLEIVSGIDAGDELVAAGATFLNDGDTVRLVRP